MGLPEQSIDDTQTTSSSSQDSSVLALTRSHVRETPADKRYFFNFFLENNDIFQVIHPKDEEFLKERKQEYLKRTFTWTASALAGTLLVDKLMKRHDPPRLQAKKFKKTAFMSKYLGVPLLSFAVCKAYFCKDWDNSFRGMADKYSFTFDDYNRAMNILDKASNAGKLDELLNKGKRFDWETVPGGKPSMEEPVKE